VKGSPAMAQRAPRAILPVLLVSLSVSACGYRDPSRASQVRATAESFLSSCARDRPLRAMQILTEPLRDTFVRLGTPARACAGFLGLDPGTRTDVELLQAFRETTIVSITLRGGAAAVRLAVPGAAASVVSLEFSEGAWRVDSGPGSA
jgi:hypothetical protein